LTTLPVDRFVISDSNRDVADTEARESLAQLADEQAALRRVATLVAQGVQPHELFAVVAEEVGRVVEAPLVSVARYEPDHSVRIFGTFPLEGPLIRTGSRVSLEGVSVLGRIRANGVPARIDDYTGLEGEIADRARKNGIRSGAGVPIVVAGHVWGAIVAWSPERLPDDFEARLDEFTKLLAAAIGNAEATEALALVAKEQAALRRVATLVAQAAPPNGGGPEPLFRAVADEVQALLGASLSVIVRFEDDGTATTLGTPSGLAAAGTRHPLDPNFAVGAVRRTRRAARFETDDPTAAGMPAVVRETGLRSAVASPIFVEGEVWGAICVASVVPPLPPDTERRLDDFTELVATAIVNTDFREALARLAEEQAALRRVATLVAEEVTPERIFAAVCEQVGHLLEADITALEIFPGDGTTTLIGVWSNEGPSVPVGRQLPLEPDTVAGRIVSTRAPARRESDDADVKVGPFARDLQLKSTVGVPILVSGRLWGALMAGTNRRDPWAEEAETRLAAFTELVATAIANAESRDVRFRLADEQAALRRVATLVARDAPPGEVFDVVAMEVGTLLDADTTVVGRYDGDGAATAIGSWSASPGGVTVGTRSVVGGHNVLTLVAETERPARVDGYDDATGEASEIARHHGWRSSIAAPIIVEGRVWGVTLVATQRAEPFPAGAQERLAAFTDLVATALANAQAHDAVRLFGEEQAALGRVATLVAAGAAPEQVFTAVVEEVSSLLGLERIELVHYDGDVGGTVIASTGDHPFPAGSSWSLDDPSVMATVARTRRPARMDDYTTLTGEIAEAARAGGFRSAIGAPINVEGHLWGVIIAISTDPEPIPERSQARLGQFTELVATAIANAEARDALAQLADEQAALRRVATLVAQGVQPETILSAVGVEIGRLFGSSITTVGRFEPDTQALVALGVGTGSGIPIGSRWELDDALAAAQVFHTGRSVRVDDLDWSALQGGLAQIGGRLGVASTVASPIFVEGRLWGVVSVSDDKPLPRESEVRLEKFSELIATAIANAESSAELAASRRRIVAAADDARRRIERDLHDGIQQRLIALTFRARAMTRRPPPELPGLAAELSDGLKEVSDELREVSRGIHPTILTEAGLGPALRALARRSNVPIDVDVNLDERLPAPVEAAAYYIASEALTNVEKHAQASLVELIASHDDAVLMLEIRDDGVGGVDAKRGSGILGLTDRVEALGGTITIASPAHGGTTLSVKLPIMT
jgi:GAF domain-containing protein